MVNVLLDECLPIKLKYRIEELDSGFAVKTVQQTGWNSFPDGKLLAKAEKDFDVFVTSDRNLQFQQPLGDIEIHVLLLIAPTNIYEDLLPLVDKLKTLITRKPGHLTKIK